MNLGFKLLLLVELETLSNDCDEETEDLIR